MLLQMILPHSFSRLNNISLYMYIHHIFSSYSSVDRHLGCFKGLVIANSAALTIGHIFIPLYE